MSGRSAMWAIFGVFFFESLAIGQWIPRIPDIKTNLALSDAQLGLALLALPLGALPGFAMAGRVVHRLGLKTSSRIFLPLWALFFMTPALAQSFWQLLLALFFSGIIVGLIETAMNTEAARIENDVGKRLMSRCHGFWSLGTMAGALMGGALAQFGLSVGSHFLFVMPVIALGGYLVATALPEQSKDDPENTELASAQTKTSEPISQDVAFFTLPDRTLLLLCVMPLGTMMVEGAFIDWSAVFMRDVMTASPVLIAITYSFFSTVMAVVRLSGDYISEHVKDVQLVRASGLASTLGVTLFALAPSTLWAFAGAAIAGAGVAIVFPLAVTAAANRPGRSSADNVAALSMIAFSAMLVAPGFIGFLSEAIGLRFALLSLAPVAFVTFLLANEAR